MQPPKLKTFRPGMPLGGNVFFLLSKGNNAGRPQSVPCPNCFVAVCESKEQLDFWTSVCTALWLSKRFELLLIGSVIPFIRIGETAKLLATMRSLDTEQVQRSAKELQLIDDMLRASNERVKSIEQLRYAYARQFTRLL